MNVGSSVRYRWRKYQEMAEKLRNWYWNMKPWKKPRSLYRPDQKYLDKPDCDIFRNTPTRSAQFASAE